jgi:hypothetical protein
VSLDRQVAQFDRNGHEGDPTEQREQGIEAPPIEHRDCCQDKGTEGQPRKQMQGNGPPK